MFVRRYLDGKLEPYMRSQVKQADYEHKPGTLLVVTGAEVPGLLAGWQMSGDIFLFVGVMDPKEMTALQITLMTVAHLARNVTGFAVGVLNTRLNKYKEQSFDPNDHAQLGEHEQGRLYLLRKGLASKPLRYAHQRCTPTIRIVQFEFETACIAAAGTPGGCS